MSERRVKQDDLMDFIETEIGAGSEQSLFNSFEPWDVKDRPEWVHDIASEYNLSIRTPELLELFGGDTHEFQTGYLMDPGFIGVMFASNQSGKSYCALIDILIQLTGIIPLSLQHPKGYDTGVLRPISENNIRRYGRRDAETGEVIDYDYSLADDPSPFWNCGTVKGAGVYQKEKLAKQNSKAWIVTYKQARDETWWPQLKGIIPKELLDLDRAKEGFDNRNHIVYLQNLGQIHFITYEQGEARLEAAGNRQEFETLHLVLFDEEPPSSNYWATITQRVSQVRLVTTPYKGLSWTYKDILQKAKKDTDIHVYHCTKFDCPYHDKEDIIKSMSTIKPWEIGARVFGLHTEQSGRPYYEEVYPYIMKSLLADFPCDYKTIYPSFSWDTPIDIAMNRDDIKMSDCTKEKRDAWQVYEMPQPDTAYFAAIDSSEGAAKDEDAQDSNSCQICREPKEGEPDWPVQVAVLSTSLQTAEFARLCLYGCAAYNNAIMIPEAIGKSAGTFFAIISEDTSNGTSGQGWPFLYTMVVINDLNKRPTEKKGFYTSSKNRTQLFDYVGSMMKDSIHLYGLNIKEKRLRDQIAGCIVGRNRRPDHGKGKHDDSLVAYGIACYLFKISRQMIRNNRDAFSGSSANKEDPWTREGDIKKETRPILGGRGLDQRKRDKGRRSYGRRRH